MMAAQELTCLSCTPPIPLTTLAETGAPPRTYCPVCGVAHEVIVYPAFFQAELQTRTGQRLSDDQEASCFHHPTKRAEVICLQCGRFLCALCATDLDDQPICLHCLTQRQATGADVRLEKQRVLYDEAALALALLPLIAWPFTAVTAPIAMYLVLRYWHKGTTSLVSRSRIRYVLAFFLALTQIVAWIGFGVTLFRGALGT